MGTSSSGAVRSARSAAKAAAAASPWPQQRRGTHSSTSSGRRGASVVPRAGGADSSGPRVLKELPIFPLGVVALPHATVPLMIFEPRCVAFGLD
jgi:hypothetical protein